MKIARTIYLDTVSWSVCNILLAEHVKREIFPRQRIPKVFRKIIIQLHGDVVLHLEIANIQFIDQNIPRGH